MHTKEGRVKCRNFKLRSNLVSSPVVLYLYYSYLKLGLCAFVNELEELPEQKDTWEFAALLSAGTFWNKGPMKAYLNH